jgi:microcompartment protein CcmK/EutM
LLIGEVVGTVVATQKDVKLTGLKLQVVRELDERGGKTPRYVVAVDAVGAGHGDRVLVCTGSSARQTVLTDGKPADAVIMAILDSWDVDGETIWSSEDQAPVRGDDAS